MKGNSQSSISSHPNTPPNKQVRFQTQFESYFKRFQKAFMPTAKIEKKGKQLNLTNNTKNLKNLVLISSIKVGTENKKDKSHKK